MDYGPDFFDNPEDPFDPDTIGATASREFTKDYELFRQRLRSNPPEAAELTLYNALTNSFVVPVEFNDKTVYAPYVKMTATVGRALGLEPDITNPESVPLFGGDALIGFNSQQDFDFNPNDNISPGHLDFFATAVHEIAHALGFVSESGGTSELSVAPIDLFRVRPGTVLPSNLSTLGPARRVMSLGGTQVFFSNRLSSTWTLDASAGVQIIIPQGPGDTDISSSGEVQACRKGFRANFCLPGQRSAAASALGGVRKRTPASASYSYRLNEFDLARFTASYARAGQPVGGGSLPVVVEEERDYFAFNASYEKRLTERLAVGASARYRDIFGGDQSVRADVSGQLFLRARFGQLQ